MTKSISLLYERGKNIAKEIKKKHIDNRILENDEKKIVKMLEHFNDRLHSLETLCKEAKVNLLICNFIIADLQEMILDIEKSAKQLSLNTDLKERR